MTAAKTAAQRKADERKRMRVRGYVLRQFWVHPDDWNRVRAYLTKINKQRNAGALAPKEL